MPDLPDLVPRPKKAGQKPALTYKLLMKNALYSLCPSVNVDSVMRLTRREFMGTAAGTAVGLGLASVYASDPGIPLFSFGVLADAQYADRPPSGTRFYRRSPDRIAEALEAMNREPLAFILQLGDLIDRDLSSLDRVLPLFDAARVPVHHVLGNHDFLVDDAHKLRVPSLLGIPERYREVRTGSWRILLLDGNGYGAEMWPAGHPNRERAERMIRDLEHSDAPNARPWNGAVDDEQLAWLDQRLAEADRAKQSVLLCCHFPVLPVGGLTLLNDRAVLETLHKHPSVKVWMNGHDHSGGFAADDGIQFVTFRGMVETADSTAWAVVDVYADRLQIRGFGREPDRMLRLV